jgi:hypothetical protein
MIPGSVQEVRLRKMVVVITERKRRMGRAGVTLSQTYLMTKTQKRMMTSDEQIYQQELAPQSLMEPVMQQPQ